MLKLLKIKGDESKIFFAGCLHHNHNPDWPIPLWKMRGFNSVQGHDEFQILKWNESCNEDSIVFLLGDTIFSDSTGESFYKLFSKLRFKQVWIQPGNHTSGYMQNYKKTLNEKFGAAGAISCNEIIFEVYPLEMPIGWNKTIKFIPNYAELDINSQQICISHYAIRSWNKMARNSWMLHSHEHCANPTSDWETTDCGKIADVGYENLLKYNDGSPISMDKLRKFMNKKAYKSEGHH